MSLPYRHYRYDKRREYLTWFRDCTVTHKEYAITLSKAAYLRRDTSGFSREEERFFQDNLTPAEYEAAINVPYPNEHTATNIRSK